jgi:hypothetical protein
VSVEDFYFFYDGELSMGDLGEEKLMRVEEIELMEVGRFGFVGS